MDRKLKQEIMTLLSQICGALSDPNRIYLLCLLSDKPRNVGELTEELDLPQSTVSRHLKVLRERGLVFSERQGQFVLYKLADDRIISALNTLRAIVLDMLREQVALAHTVKDSLEDIIKAEEQSE